MRSEPGRTLSPHPSLLRLALMGTLSPLPFLRPGGLGSKDQGRERATEQKVTRRHLRSHSKSPHPLYHCQGQIHPLRRGRREARPLIIPEPNPTRAVKGSADGAWPRACVTQAAASQDGESRPHRPDPSSEQGGEFAAGFVHIDPPFSHFRLVSKTLSVSESPGEPALFFQWGKQDLLTNWRSWWKKGSSHTAGEEPQEASPHRLAAPA